MTDFVTDVVSTVEINDGDIFGSFLPPATAALIITISQMHELTLSLFQLFVKSTDNNVCPLLNLPVQSIQHFSTVTLSKILVPGVTIKHKK